MAIKYADPFESGPPTKITKDKEGKPEIQVTLSALSPLGARCRNVISLWLPIIVMGFQIMSLLQYSSVPLEIWAKSLLVPWLLYPISHVLLSWLFQGTAKLVFTQGCLALSCGNGWTKHSLYLTHQFSIITHDKAERESEKQIPPAKRYYKKSRTLTFLIYGQRFDILNIYGIRKAQAFLARLQACEEWINATCQRGAGLSAHTENDFSLQPGNIIDAADLFRNKDKDKD